MLKKQREQLTRVDIHLLGQEELGQLDQMQYTLTIWIMLMKKFV